jgi:heme-degrading monooxygenase HmoA
MILEVAILDVRPESTAEFEAAFREAQTIIASMPGYLTHQLQRCVEHDSRYLLLVETERQMMRAFNACLSQNDTSPVVGCIGFGAA